jgi:DNA polymerase elongation subunit (family B)
MLLDAICFDKLPNYIDITSPLVGDDFCPNAECDDTTETCLALLGRSSNGDSICVFYAGYMPWSRILCHGSQDINTVKKNVAQSLSIEFNDIKVLEEERPKFFGFVPGAQGAKKFQCFKIYFKTFDLVRKFEYIFRFSGGFKKSKAASGSVHYLTSHFESTDFNTPNNIKALNELGLTPSSWFHCDPVASSRRYTTCKFEGRVTSISLVDQTSLAPIKVLSFDAEMYSHDNTFPDVLHGDFTTAICASIMVYGSDVRRRKAFVLWNGSGLDVKTPGLEVHYAETTDDLLELFRDFVALEDPDIITGWNIYGFDMPFLWDQYESSHSKRSQRGSEQMRHQMSKALGREFFTSKDLSAKCPSFDASKSIDQIRWKLAAKKPHEFPERIACNTRSVLRAKLNMPSEESNFSLEDFDLLKKANIPYFNTLMDPPRRESSRRFEYMSRFICEKSELSEKRMASSAKGDNTYYYWSGRTCVDLMQIIKDDKKLDENTLKFCAQTFLDPEYGKIDLSPAEIFKAYREKDASKMAAMLDYCSRDADIPLDLIQKLSYISQWFEMSRVTFTPVAQVLNGGQQRKVFNLISHFVHSSHAMNTGLTDWPESNDDDGSYQGATVIEPATGFYTNSVSTLDFESLYPSIIIHFNLCPSVYVRSQSEIPDCYNVERHSITHVVQDKTFEKTYGFVKNVQGIIPQLLQSLLKSRKAAKKAMNSAPNDFERAVQNGRQLALKVSCNSVYGFFGVNEKRGLLSCKPIAAVTTLRGRAFIEAAKNYVERTYTGSKVLYGDTDSIMIQWSSTDDISISKAYKLAEEASASITQLLRNGLVEGASKPMLESAVSAVTLANEKVYSPYLLIQKKTYAGLKYELKAGHSPESDADFHQSIDMKGIDAVRRDRSKLVKTMSENILQSLLFKKDIKSAIKGLLDDVTAVADGTAPLEWFVLSKSLKGSYKTENQPHVQAWIRMTQRGDDEVPEIGSRMPYVIVASKKKGPLYEHTEHPDFVRRTGLKYCARYYLENARDVVERLLSPTAEAQKVTQIFSDALHAADRRTSGNMSLLSFFKKS